MIAICTSLVFTGCASSSKQLQTGTNSFQSNVSPTQTRSHVGNKQRSSRDSNSSKIGLVSHIQDDGTQDPVEPKNVAQDQDNNATGTEDSLIRPALEPADPVEPSNETSSRSPEATVSLTQVLTSVANCYPEIEIALGEIQTASGKALAAQGKFDHRFTAHSISQPLGFYQTFRNGVGLARPLFGGGEVYGTYRIGDGNFEPWFGERETNEGGELKAGFSLPLLKDRDIDKRRAELFGAQLQQSQVNANVDARLLVFQRMATQSYWDWVASGQAIKIQERLLQLAQDRVEQIKERIGEGGDDLEGIAQIDNDRFIAKRTNSLIKAKRALEKAAIKLSLFWRDAGCAPVVANESQLPGSFPKAVLISENELLSDITQALSVRPELDELRVAREEALVQLRYAQNLTLPKVDLKGFAGQDVGGETSSTGDKTPFELQLGVIAEVPIQRREGLGKIDAARGKLVQINAKTQFMRDKIRAEVQDAASAVNAAFRQIEQSTVNLELTRESLRFGKIRFNADDINLIELNIRETAVADAELELLDAQFKYFVYRAVYETAIRREAFVSPTQ